MTRDIRPYPDIGSAAWTVLLRHPKGVAITPDTAAQIVGADLACEALTQLDAKHLFDDGSLSPLARTLRRWYENRPGR